MNGADHNLANQKETQDFEQFADRRTTDAQVTLHTEHDLEIVIDQPATLKELQHSTNVTELATAHAAVVLAKAQAAAARQVEFELRQDVELLKRSLDTETNERSSLAAELEVARKQYIDLDKQLAIEKTRLAELRKQADQEHFERLRLAKRIEQFEDRSQLSAMTRLKRWFATSKDDKNS